MRNGRSRRGAAPPAFFRLKLLCLGAVLALAAVTFLPVLDNGFTSWDDNVYLTENPLVRDLSPGGIRRIFTTYVSGNYHPLVFLVHAVEHRLFGLDPRPYHATSLALHLLAAALVFEALHLLCGALPAAVAGTLLWSLHPLRVESVAWVADRKDLLAAVFFLAALVAWLRAARDGRPRRVGWAVLLFFLLALLSKSTAVALPLALLLCDFLRGRLDRRSVTEKLPLFALAAVFGALALLARGSYQGVLEEGTFSGPEAVHLVAHRFVWSHLARTLLPVTGLFPLYPGLEPGMGLLSPRLLVAAGIVATLAAAVALTLRRTREVAFGSLFFLAALLPSLPVTVLGFSADRFTYLPSVGLAYLAGAGFQRLWDAGAAPAAARRGGLALGFLALCGLLAALSWRQTAVWRDSVSLWTHAVASYPESPDYVKNRAFAHYYRGLAHLREGSLDPARADLDEALRLFPGRVEFLAARGHLRAARGDALGMRADLGAALEGYSRQIARGAGVPEYLERGKILVALGDREGAVADFTAALRLDPGNVTVLNARGIAYTQGGAAAPAAADFARALEIEPASAVIHLNLGILHLNRGDAAAALPLFERALALDPLSAAGHMGRARALAALGEHRRALADLDRAEALGFRPDPALRRALAARPGE